MRTIANFLKTRVPVVGYQRAEASRDITTRTIPNFLKTRVPVVGYLRAEASRGITMRTIPNFLKTRVRVSNRNIAKCDPCIVLALALR